MLRVNLLASEFEEKRLLRTMLRSVLVTKSLGRLKLERSYWVFDAFPDWWRTRQEPLGKDAEQLSAALKAMPEDFSERDVERWLTLRKRAGRKPAHALGVTGLRVLQAKHGEEASRRFLSSVLGLEVEKDSRAWLRDVLHPVPSRFGKATGQPFAAFVTEWREAVREAGAALPKEAKP